MEKEIREVIKEHIKDLKQIADESKINNTWFYFDGIEHNLISDILKIITR